MADLTEKQEKFCREYVFDWNGTRAYHEAFPNVTYNTARTEASKLLAKPNIKAKIKEYKAKTEELAGISRLKVAQELKKIAFSSIAHLHDSWLTRKEFDQLTDDQKSCIQEIQTEIKTKRNASGKLEPVEHVKVKLYSKQAALDTLIKTFGYSDAQEIEGNLTVKIVRE